MIDLNHIFLFLALISPAAVLVRSWRMHAGHDGWRVAAAVVLGVTGFAWIVIRDQAGYIGGGAWFALLFLPAIGLKRMTELAARHEYQSARRLATALSWLHPTRDLRDQIRTLDYLEARKLAGDLPPPPIPNKAAPRLRNAPAVTLLIAANVFFFGVELALMAAGTNEAEVLYRLGAVQPPLVLVGHQYWRLFAALFLHAGVVHLLFNLFALYVLGPPFERTIGSFRFLVCYLVSGLCSTTGVVMLWTLRGGDTDELVGASGCVMGIVGASAAFLIRDQRTPVVRQRLLNILMIVVVQTIFDLTTRQVSMSAHLFGAAGGFLVGLAGFSRGTNRNLRPEASVSG